MKRKTAAAASGSFTAYGFQAYRTDAHVLRDGQHFMTVNTIEGAKRLAALLNDAVALASEAGAIGIEQFWSERKIAHAVANALGEKIDFTAERAA